MKKEEQNEIETKDIRKESSKDIKGCKAMHGNMGAKEIKDVKEVGCIKDKGAKGIRNVKDSKLTNGSRIIFMDSKESSSGVQMKKTPLYHFEVGDVVKLKKQHPCGSSEWEILRVGSDFHLKCKGCGHLVTMPRRLVEKNIRKLTKKEDVQ